MIKATCHKVCYHATDSMRCVHHSNYIRWFEEARTDFLEQAGLPYAKIEEDGFMAPIISLDCEYRNMTRYGENVYICALLEKYNGVSFTFYYEVYGAEDKLLKVTGHTKLCLIDQNGRVVNMKKLDNDYHEKFSAVLGKAAAIPEA